MSETRTVVTSESMMQQLTGTAPAATETKPEPTGEEVKTGAETPVVEGEPKVKKKPLIEEMVRTRHERNEARTENERLRAELDEIRQKVQTNQIQAPAKELDPRPVRTQFVSDDDYQEALTDWKVDQKLAERQQQDQQARENAVRQQLSENWDKRLGAAKAAIPDYDEVVGKSDINLPNPLYVAIVESDVGPQLAYYLSANPDEAKRLMGMSVTAALKMIGRLEDRLIADEKPATKDPAKPAAPTATPERSKAPPPIEPLKDASSPVEKPTSQMTYAEYKAHRQAQQAARRR